MKKRKVPMRKCLGCDENKEKKDLIRIVKTPDDNILIDLKGKENGRGAYICNDIDCFNNAIETNRIPKSLRTNIPKDKIDELKNKIKDG